MNNVIKLTEGYQVGVFNNPSSAEKTLSRWHMLGHFNSFFTSKDRVSSFTLPASNFIFEQLLSRTHSAKSLNMVTAEKDIEVFKEGRNTIMKNRLKRLHGDAFELIASGLHGRFNYIWLDMCSSLSPALIENIGKLVTSDNIYLPCMLSLTVQKARESLHIKQLFESSTTLQEFRKEGFPKLLAKYAGCVHRDCTLVEVYNYKSSNKISAPMSIYTFTITNK